MSIESEILEQQLKHGIFENASFSGTKGIAKFAIANGFDALTIPQKNVIWPYLKQQCTGIVDPGGHHNGCTNILEEKELLDAYHRSIDTDSLICEACETEEGYYNHQRAKMDLE